MPSVSEGDVEYQTFTLKRVFGHGYVEGNKKMDTLVNSNVTDNSIESEIVSLKTIAAKKTDSEFNACFQSKTTLRFNFVVRKYGDFYN